MHGQRIREIAEAALGVNTTCAYQSQCVFERFSNQHKNRVLILFLSSSDNHKRSRGGVFFGDVDFVSLAVRLCLNHAKEQIGGLGIKP